MASDNGQNSGWGITHLSNMPVTLSFGMVLLGVLVLLVVLRILFGEVRVGGSVGGGVK